MRVPALRAHVLSLVAERLRLVLGTALQGSNPPHLVYERFSVDGKIVDLVFDTARQSRSGTSRIINQRFSVDDGKMSMMLLLQGLPLISSMTASPRFYCPMKIGSVIKFLDNLHEETSSKLPTETVVEEWEEASIDDVLDELQCERAHSFQLRAENFQLRAQIAQLKAENAQVEETVRQDVCEELSKQIEAMEHACKLRIEDMRLAMDHKWKGKLDILSREISRRSEEEADWAICQLETKVQDLQDQLGLAKSRTCKTNLARPTEAHVATPAHSPALSTEDHPLAHPEKPEEEHPLAHVSINFLCADVDAQLRAFRSAQEEQDAATSVDRPEWCGDAVLPRHVKRMQAARNCHVDRMQAARKSVRPGYTHTHIFKTLN